MSNQVLFGISLAILFVVVYILGNIWFVDKRNRTHHGMFALGISVSIWILANAFFIIASPEYYVLFYTLRVLSFTATIGCAFWFAKDLNTKSRFLNARPLTAIVWILTAADAFIILTDQWHHFYFAAYNYPIAVLAPPFWIHYSILLLVWILAIGYIAYFLSRNVKRQSHKIILLLALCLPLAVNVGFVTNTFHLFGVYHDLTPLAFFIMFGVIALISNPVRGFQIQSLGAAHLLANSENRYFIADLDDRILDTNMRNVYFGLPEGVSVVGASAVALVENVKTLITSADPADLMDLINNHETKNLEGEFTLNEEGLERTFRIKRSLISEKNRIRGYAVLLIDVSQYRSMIREVESASTAKSNFLANMSHEMRTPLNAIIGISEILTGRDLAKENQKDVEQIYVSGMNLLGLINDILDISKIEAGKMELNLTEYDTPSLINDTISFNKVRIGSKPIELVLDIREDLPSMLNGDDLKVKQIFNNLLSNAIKYTKEGTVAWTLRTEREGDSVWLVSTVSDTGIGIRESDIEKLFTDYNQVDTKSNRSIEGTGLGLSITEKLVRLMDGSIDVRSEYGKGTIFMVRIRQGFAGDQVIGSVIAENLKSSDYAIKKHDRSRNIARACIPYARVLVVDDVQTNLDVARGFMKPYGMTVDTVTSGEAAIKLIRAEEVKYRAVFMDHMMPGMDGIEAVHIIRNEIGTDYAKNIPIIALTANAISGNEKMFKDNGFQDFLSKPIDLIKLNDVINRWVRDKEWEKEPCVTCANTENEIHWGDFDIEGIDLAAGAEKFADDRIYYDILKSFAGNTPDLLTKLRGMGDGDLGGFEIIVHGIKSSCYSILANDLGKDAEMLEHAAKAGDFDYVSANKNKFLQKAERLALALRLATESIDAGEGKPVRDKPDEALLREIKEAAAHYNITALDRGLEELDRYVYEDAPALAAWIAEKETEMEMEAIEERLSEMLKIYQEVA
ncbi:hypothetical protein AGMMS49983_11540 [Clostridia bacterium]|nr:hypothetical protein AGMMS49983_11540 [Clostridia bacterium]